MKILSLLAGLMLVGLLASPISGCSTSGARPAYHISTYSDPYWGRYGYRRGGYAGYYGHRIGRPAYYRGRYRY